MVTQFEVGVEGRFRREREHPHLKRTRKLPADELGEMFGAHSKNRAQTTDRFNKEHARPPATALQILHSRNVDQGAIPSHHSHPIAPHRTSSHLVAPCRTFLFNKRIRLDLDQHLRIDEPRHFDHGRGGKRVAEKLAVCSAHVLPVGGDVDDVHARAHDIL